MHFPHFQHFLHYQHSSLVIPGYTGDLTTDIRHARLRPLSVIPSEQSESRNLKNAQNAESAF